MIVKQRKTLTVSSCRIELPDTLGLPDDWFGQFVTHEPPGNEAWDQLPDEKWRSAVRRVVKWMTISFLGVESLLAINVKEGACLITLAVGRDRVLEPGALPILVAELSEGLGQELELERLPIQAKLELFQAWNGCRVTLPEQLELSDRRYQFSSKVPPVCNADWSELPTEQWRQALVLVMDWLRDFSSGVSLVTVHVPTGTGHCEIELDLGVGTQERLISEDICRQFMDKLVEGLGAQITLDAS